MALTKEKRNLFILVSFAFGLIGIINLIVFTFFIHANLQKVEKPPPRIISFNQFKDSKLIKKNKPRVYFDILIGGKPEGRLIFQLFYDTTPITAENFRALATGEKGKSSSGVPLSYTGTIFHYVIPGFICQGGDITSRLGMGSLSIYGPSFPDENFDIKHTRKGLLSMANKGTDTNGSQFFITLGPSPHLDNKHVVFGEVVEGFDVLEKIAQVGSAKGETSLQVLVTDSGQL